MKVRILINDETPTQVKIQQRCAAHWREAIQWQQAQRPRREVHDGRPFNTVEAQLTAKVPAPRVTFMGLGVA